MSPDMQYSYALTIGSLSERERVLYNNVFLQFSREIISRVDRFITRSKTMIAS